MWRVQKTSSTLYLLRLLNKKTVHWTGLFIWERMATSYDYPYYKTPCSIIVAGPSQCGKTTFTRQLLRCASRAFDRPVRRIVYCYGEPQRCFKDMQCEGIHFHKGIPKNIQSLFPKHLRPGILVLLLDAWLRAGSTRAGFVHQRFASQRRHVHLPDAKFVSAWEIRTDHFPEHALRAGLQKPARCCGCSQFGSAGVPRSRPVRHGLFPRCHQSAVRVPALWSPSLHARSASSPNESFNTTDHRVSRT